MRFLDRFKHKKTAAPIQAESEKKTRKVDEQEVLVASSSINTPVRKGHALAFQLLTKPHVSEKVGALGERGTYVFQVPPEAEKIAIKRAVESLYGVHVTAVRTARYDGKPIYRGRRPGRRKAWKKAFVTVKQGEKIDLYEGV